MVPCNKVSYQEKHCRASSQRRLFSYQNILSIFVQYKLDLGCLAAETHMWPHPKASSVQTLGLEVSPCLPCGLFTLLWKCCACTWLVTTSITQFCGSLPYLSVNCCWGITAYEWIIQAVITHSWPLTSHPRGHVRIQTVLCNISSESLKPRESIQDVHWLCCAWGICAAEPSVQMKGLYIPQDGHEAEKGGVTSWCLAPFWVWSFEEFLLLSWLWGGHECLFLETGESSYSEKTLTPFSVPLWHPLDGWGNSEPPHWLHLCFVFTLGRKAAEWLSKELLLFLGAGEAQRPMPRRDAACRDVQVTPRVTLGRAQGVTCHGWGPQQFCRGVLGLPPTVGVYLCVCRRAGHGQKKRRNYLSQQLKDVQVTQLKKNWISRGEGSGRGWWHTMEWGYMGNFYSI